MIAPSPDSHDAAVAVVVNAMRSAFDRAAGLTLAQRQQALNALRRSLVERAPDYVKAIGADFQIRSRHETLLTEIGIVLTAIDYTIPRLKHWTKPRSIRLGWPYWPSRASVIYQPRGVAGIISPANYPLQLALMPLVSSISAGCRTVIKPSEQTPETSRLLFEHVSDVFDNEVVAVVCGDASAALTLARLKLDILLFTGSSRAGKEIALAAASNVTPLVLELGGKSAAVIDRGADLRAAVKTLLVGKLLNSGQTCVAPDYVLLPHELLESFIAIAPQVAEELYPEPGARDYSGLLGDGAARLQSFESGQRIVPLFHSYLDAPRYRPALIINPPLQSPVMTEEIFGPLLPVLTYQDFSQVIDVIRAVPSPLAIYWLGKEGPRLNHLIAATASGSVAVNATVIHSGIPALPFGGIGQSGYGRYHGETGFKAFSNERTIFRQSRLSVTRLMQPPYGDLADRILKSTIRQR